MNPNILLGTCIALLVASVIPVQAIVNGRLGHLLHNPLLAALISFTGGTSTIILILLCSQGIPQWPKGVEIPWYLFTGGLYGVLFVTSSLIMVNWIGTANLIAATVAGQLITAIVIDHFGLFGMAQQAISLPRVLGCLLMLGGLFLIQSKF